MLLCGLLSVVCIVASSPLRDSDQGHESQGVLEADDLPVSPKPAIFLVQKYQKYYVVYPLSPKDITSSTYERRHIGRSTRDVSATTREGRFLFSSPIKQLKQLKDLLLLTNLLSNSVGAGTLSTTNSFNLFGKTINSALSVAYGDRFFVPPLLPPVPPIPVVPPIPPVPPIPVLPPVPIFPPAIPPQIFPIRPAIPPVTTVVTGTFPATSTGVLPVSSLGNFQISSTGTLPVSTGNVQVSSTGTLPVSTGNVQVSSTGTLPVSTGILPVTSTGVPSRARITQNNDSKTMQGQRDTNNQRQLMEQYLEAERIQQKLINDYNNLIRQQQQALSNNRNDQWGDFLKQHSVMVGKFNERTYYSASNDNEV
ncbi:uncharacterized protein [Periplaneta americana]|uniref:uncharacterized protein n=1 Tax=Periplaneta americana TaxID=6978 RepID=UPI0037E83BB3